MSVARYTYVDHLACVTCRRTFRPDEGTMTCPSCGPLLGTLDVRYDCAGLARDVTPADIFARPERTHWRYHELLPVPAPELIVDFPVGMTPLVRARLGPGEGTEVFVKDDSRNPSGSLKDRASSVAVALAARGGKSLPIACASTGNAASSLAALCARAGRPCLVFVPRTAPVEKLTQLLLYGARVFMVEGTYDDAFDLCAKVCARFGFYNRNTAVNPYLGEGKKTAALEIWEQLGGRAPDAVIVPVGDGCIVSGVHKGFADLREAGWIEKVPRLVGAQAEGSSAIARAWEAGAASCGPYEARTIADSISVSVPRDQVKALRAVRATGGAFVRVTDEEILAALAALASGTGIFVEPAAAASVAAFLKASAAGDLDGARTIVLLVTGYGLKDVASARKAVAREPVAVRPDVDAVARIIEKETGLTG